MSPSSASSTMPCSGWRRGCACRGSGNEACLSLVISSLAMALGTVSGLALGFARISLLAPVRGTSWIVVQFFRNAPWLVLLFFVMLLLPFELRIGGVTIPFPDWIKATLGLAL